MKILGTIVACVSAGVSVVAASIAVGAISATESPAIVPVTADGKAGQAPRAEPDAPLQLELWKAPEELPPAPFYPEPAHEGLTPFVERAAEPAKFFPERVVMATEGDTAFSLALEYYGSRSPFRSIIDANPDLNWADRLLGKEVVVLPEYGIPPADED